MKADARGGDISAGCTAPSLSHAVDSGIMRSDTFVSCQSAAASEIIQCCRSRMSHTHTSCKSRATAGARTFWPNCFEHFCAI